jgi:periplasmic protein TonB
VPGQKRSRPRVAVGVMGTLILHVSLVGSIVMARLFTDSASRSVAAAPDVAMVTIPLEPPPDVPPSPPRPDRVPSPSVNVTPPLEAPPIQIESEMTAAVNLPVEVSLPPAEEAATPPLVAAKRDVIEPREETQAAEQAWEDRVLAALERKKRYPAVALWRRQEDVVYLYIVLDRSGIVLETRVKESHGIRVLDVEAMQLPARASPLPAPPESVDGERIELLVPIQFYIRGHG